MARPATAGGRRENNDRSSQGFTLIEVIIVLAVLAMVVGFALPQFAGLHARLRVTLDRGELERQLLQLPQRVRQSGHGGIVTARSADDLPDGTILPLDDVPQARTEFEHWQVLRLALPGEWRLRVERPIFYHFTGVCEGGDIAFVLPPVALHYRLAPPLCRPLAAPAEGG